MLILSRKQNEGIIINDDIVINILEVSGDKVRIGIEAPEKYIILRKELAEDVKISNKDANNATPELIGILQSLLNK